MQAAESPARLSPGCSLQEERKGSGTLSRAYPSPTDLMVPGVATHWSTFPPLLPRSRCGPMLNPACSPLCLVSVSSLALAWVLSLHHTWQRAGAGGRCGQKGHRDGLRHARSPLLWHDPRRCSPTRSCYTQRGRLVFRPGSPGSKHGVLSSASS